MNVLLLVTLGGYMAHAVFTHWRQGPETDESDSHLHRGMPFPVMPLALFLVCQVLGTPAIADRLLTMQALAVGAVVFLWLLLRQVKKMTAEGEVANMAFRCFYVVGGMLQTALLGLSVYAAYEAGALGRGLFTPGWVILGLAVGHGVFGVSLCFSHRSLDSLQNIARYMTDLRPLMKFVGDAPRQLFACLDVSLMEEIIYRVAVQGALIALTGSPILAVVIVAIVFSAVHRHFFYNHVVDSIEFLAFSLLLGGLYYGTGSLMLVVVVHTVRNLEIVYFDNAEHSSPEDGALMEPAEAQ